MPIFRPLPRVPGSVVLPGRVILTRRLLQGVAAGLPAFNVVRAFFRNLSRSELVRLFRGTANLLEAGFAAESLPAGSRQLLNQIPIVSDLGERGTIAERLTYAIQLTFEREPDVVEERLVYVLTDAPLTAGEAKAEAITQLRGEVGRARRRVDYEGELLPVSSLIESEIIFVGRRF